MKIPPDIKTRYAKPFNVRISTDGEATFVFDEAGGILNLPGTMEYQGTVLISTADLIRLDYVAEDHAKTRKILGADLVGPNGSQEKGSVLARRAVDERDIARRHEEIFKAQRDCCIGEAEREKKRADEAEQKVHEVRRDLTNFQSRHGAAACGLITTPPAPFNTRSGDVVAQTPFNTTALVATNDIAIGDVVLMDFNRGTATSVGKAVPMNLHFPNVRFEPKCDFKYTGEGVTSKAEAELVGERAPRPPVKGESLAIDAEKLAAQARRLQKEITADREKAIREANARAVERLRNLKADVLALYDQMIAAMTPKP